MSITDEKAAMRRHVLARRTAGATRRAGARAARTLATVLDALPGRVVAGYMPIGSEADPVEVLRRLARSRRICLPVVAAPGRPLTFREWRPGAAMSVAVFGVAVPRRGVTLTPDILVVPIVAFDDRLMRLGYGGGFYDRTIASLSVRQPITVGFALECQRVPRVPIEPTDRRLDAVVTDRGARLGRRLLGLGVADRKTGCF